MPPKSQKKKKRGKKVKIDKNVREVDIENNPSFDFIVIPPDGGWGWLVVFSACFTLMTIDGVAMLFGVVLKEIVVSMESSESDITIASSMLNGLYFLAGPLACSMTNRFGFRFTGIAGGIFGAGGLVGASFATDSNLFLLSYGFVCGIAFSMSYIASLLAVSFYFERWRAVATAIAVTGTSVGIVVAPLVYNTILSNNNWRETYRIYAVALLMNSIMSLMYKPIKPCIIERARERRLSEDERASLMSYSLNDDNPKSIFYKKHNLAYPTNADVSSNYSPTTRTSIPGTSISKCSLKPAEWSSVMSVFNETKRKVCCCGKCIFHINRCCCITDTLQKPMYKDDILFTGSIATLPTYDGRNRERGVAELDYHMSVTRVSTLKDIKEAEKCCVFCPDSILRTMATMLDLSLMKLPSFSLLVFSGFFSYLGYYIPLIYIVDYYVTQGHDAEIAPLLVSTIGIFNGIGRMVTGLAIISPKSDALIITAICLLLAGISTIGFTFWTNSHYIFFVYSGVYGLLTACLASLRSIIAVELVGLDKLSNSIGLLVLFAGLSSMLCLPIGTQIKEYTNGYKMPMIFSGTSVAVSAALLFPLRCIARREAKMAQQLEELERTRKKAETRKRLAEINKPKSSAKK